jgi:hypothetical protein
MTRNKLWTLLLATALAPTALAGTVKSKKKDSVIVEMDDGEAVEKDGGVCFFGDGDKKVGCGVVTKVKGLKALVKVTNKKALKKITEGMSAKPGDAPADAGADTAASEGEPAAKGAKGKSKGRKGGDAETKEAKSSKKVPFRVWAGYTPGIATPATYNKIQYEATAAPDTAWKSEGAVNQALFGFSLQVGIPVGSMSFNPGFRYRTYRPSLIDTDLTPGTLVPYITTEQSATALALFFDFQLLRIPFGSSFGMNLTSGLDYDMSTVTLKSTVKTEDGAKSGDPFAKGTSKLNVVSLRAGAGFDLLFLKSFGAFFNLNLLIPLVELGKSFSGGFEGDPAQAPKLANDPSDDMKAALGHKKNGLGIDVVLGAMLAF